MPDQFYSSQAPGLKTGQDLDLGSLPSLYGSQDLARTRMATADATYDLGRRNLDPQWQQRETAMAEELANRGIPEGSELWHTKMDQMGRERADAYGALGMQSLIAGRGEMETMSDISSKYRQQSLGERLQSVSTTNQARQQAFNEMMGARATTMQEAQARDARNAQRYSQLANIIGLTPTQGAAGGIQGFFNPGSIDMLGAYQGQMQAQMANQQQSSDFFGGLLGLGGSIGAAALPLMFCDMLLKDDFRPVDVADILEKLQDIPVTSWKFRQGDEQRHIGPTAQDFNHQFGKRTFEGVEVIDAMSMFGVLLAGVQALTSRVKELEAQLEEVE
jgi:hypothetical protein